MNPPGIVEQPLAWPHGNSGTGVRPLAAPTNSCCYSQRELSLSFEVASRLLPCCFAQALCVVRKASAHRCPAPLRRRTGSGSYQNYRHATESQYGSVECHPHATGLGKLKGCKSLLIQVFAFEILVHTFAFTKVFVRSIQKFVGTLLFRPVVGGCKAHCHDEAHRQQYSDAAGPEPTALSRARARWRTT